MIVWTATATTPELEVDALPKLERLATWLKCYALPIARGLSLDRVYIAASPYYLTVSKRSDKFLIRAWEHRTDYDWHFTKGSFQIKHSPNTETESLETVDGWRFGNVGIHQHAGWWWMNHILSGLYFGASWTSLNAAKKGVQAIHAEYHLAGVDNYETWPQEESYQVGLLVKKYRQSH